MASKPRRSHARPPVEARRSFGLPLDVTLIGSVARLHRTKNLAAAIRMLTVASGLASGAGRTGSRRARLDALATIARRCPSAFISPANSAGADRRSSSRASTSSCSRRGGDLRPRGGRSRAGGRPGRRQRPRRPARGAACRWGPCALFVDAERPGRIRRSGARRSRRRGHAGGVDAARARIVAALFARRHGRAIRGADRGRRPGARQGGDEYRPCRRRPSPLWQSYRT